MDERLNRARRLRGGVMGGIVGGLAIAVFLAVSALLKGASIWPVFKGAAAPFIGARAADPSFDAFAILLGTILHFAIAIVWGLLFALLFDGFSKGATFAFGALWGVVVWAAMYYVVLPIAGMGQMARGTPWMMALIAHLVFGLGVALGFVPYSAPREAPTYRRRVIV